MTNTDVPVSLGSRIDPVKAVEVVTVPAPVAPSAHRWPAVFVAASLLLGVALRLLAFASDRPLWIDEAMIALNLTDRSVGQLFEPLDRNQTAPPAFLLAGKLCVTLFGPTEHALRLPAVVGSVLGLLAFAVAAFRLLPAWPARLAVLLFAVSPTVINYAGECKQYSSDVAVTAALFALVAPLLRTPTRGRLIALAVGGAVAVWASHPSVFVLAAAGVVLFVQSLVRREHRLAVVLCGVAWVVSFAGVYWVNVRYGTANTYLAEYWEEHFMPRSPGAGQWLVERLVDLFRKAGGYGGLLFQAAGLGAVVAAVGGVVMWRDGRRTELALLGGVFAATLLASAAQKYPFSGRLLLFLVPTAVLLLAHGTAAVAGAVWGRSRGAAALFLAAMVLAPFAEVLHQFRSPEREENLPAALKYVHERWQPGDRVYVYNGRTDVGAGPAFEFYNRRDPLPPEAVILGDEYRTDSRGYETEVREVAKSPGRVWVLLSHQHADDEIWLRAYFDAVGERTDEFRDPGTGTRTAVYCYTIR